MGLLNLLPLAVALGLAAVPLLPPFSPGVARLRSRIALVVFGSYVQRIGRNRAARDQSLRAAHYPSTFRTYGAETLLDSALLAIAGSVGGVYLLSGILTAQSAIGPETARSVLPDYLSFMAGTFEGPELSLLQLFVLLLVSSATMGVTAGLSTYSLRWWYPAHLAANRRRRIEASLPRTIAFVYALSRSGMSFPKVMGILAKNDAVYGDAADEVAVAVREMDLFGEDLLSAIQTMSRRTPSQKFREFSANLGSVLQSGQSLSRFLREQYEYYREEAEAQQEQLLDLLATLAEVYVTLFVAGPLFLLTILVVVGIFFGGTLDALRVIAYVVLPLANVAFIIYLSTITESLRATRDRIEIADPLGGIANVRRLSDQEQLSTDGGSNAVEEANLERLNVYNDYRGLRERLTRPVRTLLREPTSILYVTIPVAVVFSLTRVPATLDSTTVNVDVLGSLVDLARVGLPQDGLLRRALTFSIPDVLDVDVRRLDDIVVQTVLFITGTFALVHEAHKRRIDRIESVIPDFLDRLASINEAGMTVVESVGRVRRSDLGALDHELDRIWTDIEWGADIESALYRFERRVQTTTVTRMVTLMTNAMGASGNLAPVLRIAAEQAKADRRLKRQRQQEMLTYLVVIYIAFFVFLIIVVALNNVLIPSLPTELPDPGSTPGTGGSGIFDNIGEVDPAEYTLVFFHTALIQGALSGFIAGQMGAGNARHGAKHAAILLGLAYVSFLVLPS